MSEALIDTLNEEQLCAVRHRGAPLRIIAGAGTGKTATLTARFVDLVDSGEARVDEILALTFTHKAASEMKERIVRGLNQSYASLWVRTFHAFCQLALRQELARQGLPAPQIIQDDERMIALGAVIEGLNLPSYRNRRPELLRQALLFIDRVKDECLTPEAAANLANERGNQQLRDLASVYRQYQLHLREKGDFDFGELQSRFIEILEQDPAALRRWKDHFKYILVDEYQDVNRAQARIIELLSGDGKHLTVVGDSNQAIYAFRGASHAFLDEMTGTFPGAETLRLTRNYRSSQSILNAANALIQHNQHEQETHAELIAANQSEDGKPNVYQAASEMDEARTVARQIARRHWLDGVKYRDIAVLVRSVTTAGGAIAQAIREYDIPVVFTGRDYQATRANADVAATLRLIEGESLDPLCHVLGSYDVDPLRLIRMRAGRVEDEDFASWLAADEHAYRIVQSIRNQIAGLVDGPLSDQVYGALMVCNRLPPPDEPTYHYISYMRAFRQILDRANRLSERGGDRAMLLPLLDRTIQENAYEADPTGDAVQIMTVHAATGLEFDHVFVAGLADGRFPLTRRLDRGLDLQDQASWRIEDMGAGDGEKRLAFLEEERRLAYVALTRARKSLHLSYAQTYDKTLEAQPTFIDNITAADPNAVTKLDRTTEYESWSSTEYARTQREILQRALEAPEISGDVLGDLLLSQWTLSQLPDASTWTAPLMPQVYAGDEQLRLSYSSMSAWEECPRKYYYSNVLRLQREDSAPQLGLGTAIHDAIEWINEQRQSGAMPSEQQVIDRFRKNWPGDGFEAPAQEIQNRERGETLLRRFYRWESRQQREIISTEMPFEIPFGHHVLTGRIDCVARNANGEVEIIDYKSGRKSGTSKKDAIPQLAIYRIAWDTLHPGDSPKTSLYFLRSNKDRGLKYVPDFTFNTHSWALDLGPAEIDGVRDRLAGCANGILSNQFNVTTDPRTCERCPYSMICEGAAPDG